MRISKQEPKCDVMNKLQETSGVGRGTLREMMINGPKSLCSGDRGEQKEAEVDPC